MQLINPVEGYLKVILQPKDKPEDLYYLRLPSGDFSMTNCTDFRRDNFLIYPITDVHTMLKRFCRNVSLKVLHNYIVYVVYFYASDVTLMPYSTMYHVPTSKLRAFQTFNTGEELQEFLSKGA